SVHGVEKAAIGAHLTPVRQITSDDGKLRVGVVPIDVGDGRIESGLGVEPIKPAPWFDQVGIGDVDEFHAKFGSAINRLASGLASLRPLRKGCLEPRTGYDWMATPAAPARVGGGCAAGAPAL